MDYLIRARIEQACCLLDLTTLSIKEIAAKAGYADPYYFSRLFKKVTTCSPIAYRNIHKG
jgi:YesN/AraC family two-component response regulator